MKKLFLFFAAFSLSCCVTLTGRETLPDMPPGMFTRLQCNGAPPWRILGRIECLKYPEFIESIQDLECILKKGGKAQRGADCIKAYPPPY